MRGDDLDRKREKYYAYPICFNTEEEREEFKNIVHGLKIKRGLSIGVLSLQAIKLLKEKK